MKKVLVIFVALLLLTACGASIRKNNENLMGLQVGMAQAEVVKIMGAPALSESYEAVGGERVSILYYQTETKNVTVLSAKEECTPVVFINGKLEGWGDRLTASTINTHKVRAK
ncbi:MAG: hypothetical protein CVU61_17085 [Deltaproteobacteria bacterium HGW-Deltaproteobacteria-19]|jgi:uncharacterized protein YcfL|nr:MAG: hypothetical protein CVU61_17085 [Deltaproteobacteria bacterium HGW-Deltaproteobacteria-19]